MLRIEKQMPTYEYTCKNCKKNFCISIPFSESLSLITPCPHCKSKKTKRLWFAPGIIYRGEGFYNKDKNK